MSRFDRSPPVISETSYFSLTWQQVLAHPLHHHPKKKNHSPLASDDKKKRLVWGSQAYFFRPESLNRTENPEVQGDFTVLRNIPPRQYNCGGGKGDSTFTRKSESFTPLPLRQIELGDFGGLEEWQDYIA